MLRMAEGGICLNEWAGVGQAEVGWGPLWTKAVSEVGGARHY